MKRVEIDVIRIIGCRYRKIDDIDDYEYCKFCTRTFQTAECKNYITEFNRVYLRAVEFEGDVQ